MLICQISHLNCTHFLLSLHFIQDFSPLVVIFRLCPCLVGQQVARVIFFSLNMKKTPKLGNQIDTNPGLQSYFFPMTLEITIYEIVFRTHNMQWNLLMSI